MSTLKMNDPASALDLDVTELSEEELLALVEDLRGMRYSDLQRAAQGRAKKAVRQAGGTRGQKASLVDEMKDFLNNELDIEISPETLARITKKKRGRPKKNT